MSFPKYPAYKGSRVPWIGEVPLTWEVKAFKWLLDSNDGGVWGDDPTGEGDTLVLRSTDQTVDGNWRITDPAPRKLSAKEKASALLVEGDLVVTKSSGSSLHIGKTTLVTAEIAQQGYCYGNFMQRLRVNSSFTPKLAWYVMNNELARAQLDLLSNSTTGLANLNGTLIGEIFIPVPTVAEQTQIARFLDHETARIDALIKEQQRLIELLKEKRQAVISHAVTKGLDPMVPMKDSGVEWLGEVPVHWSVGNIKYFLEAIGDVDHYMPQSVDKGIPYVMTGDLMELASDIQFEECKQVAYDDYLKLSGRIQTSKGDVVMARYATIGSVSYVDIDTEFLVSYSCVTIKPDLSRVLGIYLFYYFKSDSFLNGIRAQTNTNTQDNVGVGDIKSLKIVLPPAAEQMEIVDYLQYELERLDAISEVSLSTISLAREKRSALISAAVTGKIDVRGWQPPASASPQQCEALEARAKPALTTCMEE